VPIKVKIGAQTPGDWRAVVAGGIPGRIKASLTECFGLTPPPLSFIGSSKERSAKEVIPESERGEFL